jgi:hypothetical protein
VGSGGKREKNFMPITLLPLLASDAKKEYFLFALAALWRQHP